MKPFLTAYDVAQLFRVDPATVLYWLKTGKLKGVKTPGGNWQINDESLAALRRNKKEV